MKVVLEKSFPLEAAPDAAWALLQDVEAVAGCMPGARITERTDASHYKGTVTVKLGPASLAFRGEIEVKEVDATGRALHLVGRGTDTTGTSGAAMDLHARIERLRIDLVQSQSFHFRCICGVALMKVDHLQTHQNESLQIDQSINQAIDQ